MNTSTRSSKRYSSRRCTCLSSIFHEREARFSTDHFVRIAVVASACVASQCCYWRVYPSSHPENELPVFDKEFHYEGKRTHE